MVSFRHARSRFWRDRRGVAALEMAAVAPFLIFVVMICVDFGRAVSQSIELTHAVKAGAQYAVTAANAQGLIEGAVRSALPSAMSTAVVTTACYCGALPSADSGLPPAAACDSACPAGSARLMTLRATYPFRPHTAFIGQTVMRTVGINQVSGNVTIRHQ